MVSSRRFSDLGLIIAGALAVSLVFVVVVVPSHSTSLLLTDLLQTAIVLWAGYCASRVAHQSVGYLRQLWTLFAVALFAVATAQGLETYYQNRQAVPPITPWPSDILFLLWVTPAVMMLLPRPAPDSHRIDWQQFLDFTQVIVVALTAYLYFFYVPSRWEAEGPQMVDKILRLQIIRDAVLAACFLGRALMSVARPVRMFFGRMALFFLLVSGSELTYFSGPRPRELTGNWTDIAWCAPYLFVALFVAGWKHEGKRIPDAPSSPLRMMIASQILPVGIPFIVLFMGHRIAAEQLTIAWIAVAASFVISAARLVYANEKQRRSEKALRVSEQRFRTLIEELHVGVILLGIKSEIQFANRAALEMFGLRADDVLGKNSSELNLEPLNEDGNEIPFALRPAPRAIASAEPVRNEVMGWRKHSSDKILWIMGDTIPIYRENGELDHLIASFSDITQRKHAEERLRQLSTHLLQLQDDERRRLGRELHDSLAQSVMAVNLDLAQLARAEPDLREKAKHALGDARETLREMAREIRTLSYLLHPPVLDELGLASAVKEYAAGFGDRSGIEIAMEIPPDFGRLPQETETALFRIVQESLANVQKHSGSTTARICLRHRPAGVELEVTDHGRGMDKSMLENRGSAKARLGVGILGMRERMIQLGGKLEVESGTLGTTVRARVPITTEAVHVPSHSNR